MPTEDCRSGRFSPDARTGQPVGVPFTVATPEHGNATPVGGGVRLADHVEVGRTRPCPVAANAGDQDGGVESGSPQDRFAELCGVVDRSGLDQDDREVPAGAFTGPVCREE